MIDGVRDRSLGLLLAVGVGIAALALSYRVAARHAWRLRLSAARFFSRFPPRLVPTPVRVLPPPNAEYVGVWEQPPATVRRRLTQEYEFTPLFRAYLHAYERADEVVYEVSSCAYRPGGITGTWQLHVRLFPAGDGRTDVWAHWERNPNTAPIAHLKREGYDPERGETALRSLVADSPWGPQDWTPEQ